MEYIEREAAIEKLNKLCDRVCQYSKAQRKYMCGACPLGDAFTVIEDDIPAADVRPVVRGRWEEWRPGDCALIMTGEEMLWMCSECTAKFSDRSAYCPNCGAEMEES